MTIIFAAATAPINPSGASPKLTLEQVWKGLELKVIKPELFLPVVEKCEVIENDGEVVVRDVTFKEGARMANPGAGPTMRERITHIKPVSSTAGSGIEIFSTLESANKVQNVVSTGAHDSELYLTFTFEWEHKEIEEGSEEAVKKQKQYQENAPRAVQGTIAKMREMIKEGKL
ncbi:Bet v1-like protein [Glarea lozoyensis ATCC 20868]|uniref:Bet v1-like protein n=1 Tax=Glarea lozoyensis (strain ATCC 20868 / MF5171) TaxID=1116229 RepID=S3D738_GLAL2|nr:Bet v1-like protein [Glarea lozoyensis ATCC 20868]EPE34297.1 Bet v1-like protein [Glarea lozoyensis ATCC 20868]